MTYFKNETIKVYMIIIISPYTNTEKYEPKKREN